LLEIYPIGLRGEWDEKVGRKTGRALRGPVGVEKGECRWSEEYNSDVVEHASEKRCKREQGRMREEKGRHTRSDISYRIE
jgi:hypothetical protein